MTEPTPKQIIVRAIMEQDELAREDATEIADYVLKALQDSGKLILSHKATHKILTQFYVD